MSKISTCRSCKKEVSVHANKCPHCGDGDPNSNLKNGCVGVIALGVIMAFLLSMCSSEEKESEAPLGNTYIAQAQLIIDEGNLADWDLNSDEYGKIMGNMLAIEHLPTEHKNDAAFIDKYGRQIEYCIDNLGVEAETDPSMLINPIGNMARNCWALIGDF